MFKLLLTLQKATCRATVQKVVTISDQHQLEKIAKECEELPEEFRKTLAYWPVDDVYDVFTRASCCKVLVGGVDKE